MLSSNQFDTVSGIVCNYKYYVVYYYADYHEYKPGEVRDSRIEIYAGSEISFEDNTFHFGDDVECYYFTNGKYLTRQPCSSSFDVNNSELVYTNCTAKYPDLCYFESQYRNLYFGSVALACVIVYLCLNVLLRLFVGGSK